MTNRWEQLLNPITFRDRSPKVQFDGRNPFENDYGRLISSSPIRRLQDKTQVFPLETSDFIRTRLTHSLEVSYIGSSIGQSIEKFLFENSHLDIKYRGHLSSLLRVAGLVHDLGNPPFGHFGEEAIQQFFREYFEKNPMGLDKYQKNDFINFDGNVQAFRILRKLHFFGDEFSFNLTFPSLASVIKYPSDSVNGNQKKEAKEIRNKKFGYFTTEREDYKAINEELKLDNRRHPAVYLLEAADDIAYCAADIEDGVKLGIVGFEDIQQLFKKHLDKNKGLNDDLIKIYESIDASGSDKLSVTIQKFRVLTQSKMIEAVIKAFEDNYNLIMTGRLEDELINVSNAKDIRKSYKQLQGILFDNKKIMQTELAGWESIYGLLNIFVPAVLSKDFDPHGNNKEARIYKMISSSYRHLYEKYSSKYGSNDTYNRIQLVVDFISGMTDSYVVSLYQNLKGIKL